MTHFAPSISFAQRLVLLLVGVVIASLAIVAVGFEFQRREYSTDYRDTRARSAAALVYSARRVLVAVPPWQRREIAQALTASGTVQLVPVAEQSMPTVDPREAESAVIRDEALRRAIERYATQPAEVLFRATPSPRYWIKQYIDGEPWWVVVLVSEAPEFSRPTPWAAILLVLSLLVVVSVLYAASITRPIERLSEATARVGASWPEPLELTGPRELQRLTQSFNAMLARLAEIETERRVLLGGIPHDLRAPLTRLRMRIAMLPEAADADGMRGDVAAMDRIVRQFADYLQDRDLDGGERTPIGAVAQELIAAHRALGHEVTLDLRVDAAWPVAGSMVRRILDNLIGNALEHGRAPVDVLIVSPDPRVLELQVTDHGSGFPESLEREACSPFVKLDEARQGAGVGLGLAIVQRLTHKLGGELRFIRSAGRFTAIASIARS